MALRRLIAPIVFLTFCIFLITSPLPKASAGSGEKKTNSLGMGFVWIAPGSFNMGSPPGESGRDVTEEQHRVTLTRGYYMQSTEVTVGQWRRFVEETGYRSEAEINGKANVFTDKKWTDKPGAYWDNPGFSQTDRHPVTCVSWNDAQPFIEWMNAKGEGTYRLPTEAEWEYAARAGSKGRFCFGNSDNDLDRYAWYDGNSAAKAHPVGTKRPNAWGLYDMHGNVQEWCSDCYRRYPSGAVTDPIGRPGGSSRPLRGGNWFTRAEFCRSADRSGRKPDSRISYNGFRLVLLPSQHEKEAPTEKRTREEAAKNKKKPAAANPAPPPPKVETATAMPSAPATAPPAPSGTLLTDEVPLMDGATVLKERIMGNNCRFDLEVPASPEEVVDFYKQAMTAKGWQPGMVMSQGPVSVLQMKKGKGQIMIKAVVKGTTSTVNLAVVVP